MLFRKKIQRSCSYCTHGVQLDEGQILCCKKGLRTPDDKCIRFRYDPCKRIPGKPKALDLRKYEKEDYTL